MRVMCYTFCNCNYITLHKIFIKYAIANHEYTDVIFIQIDQHLKKLLPKSNGVPIL